jgi:hypothetical protein
MLVFFKFQVLTTAIFDFVDERTKPGPVQGIIDIFIHITAIVISILQHELVWGTPHFSQYKPNLRIPPERHSTKSFPATKVSSQ